MIDMRSVFRYLVLAVAALLSVPGLNPASSQTVGRPGGPPGSAPPRTIESDSSVRFTVLGDYGLAGPAEAAVAALVLGMDPDLIFTVGDNNYPDGTAATIDENVGQYYHDFIAPYFGIHGFGADENRFFPALGNHDWHTPGAFPYLAYFSLPGNERYYDVLRWPVHAFVVDSDSDEPDGVTEDSIQGQWLENGLKSSGAPFKFVFMHHTPYSSSSSHGPDIEMQWPFAAWGADAVFAGHDHLYERLDLDGIPYFVNGIGGNPVLYGFESDSIAGSRSRYRRSHGAQVVDADVRRARIRLLSVNGIVFDDYSVFARDFSEKPEFLAADADEWSYLDLGTDPGPAWTSASFDDSTWAVGSGHFGYVEGDEDTLIDYGPDPNNKYITTHFRRTFTVSNPGEITELRFDLLCDDGAIAYLNGTEIVRTNLPAGPVSITTTALSAVADNIEDSLYEHDLDPGLLTAGLNVLAVEIHQVSGTSSDISFASNLQAIRDSQVLVAPGAMWSFLDDGTFPGPSWPQVGFDDSLWPVGPAELGYGDGGEATVVGFGPDPADKYPTTYFRHEFFVADAGAWDALILRLVRDDGAAVFLNGREVYRYNLPLGDLDETTAAGVGIVGAGETTYFESRIDHRKLRTGINVLAVEVHQDVPNTPDLSFDVELLGRH
jgi:hypothetical protein